MAVPGLLSSDGPVAVRVGVAIAAGAIATVLTGILAGWPYAPAAGWIVAAGVFLSWTWRLVFRMDVAQTERHARRAHEEDNTRGVSQVIVLLAALGSLGGVGYLLIAESAQGRDLAAAVVGILSVTASWFTVHTIFMLRYARLFYIGPDNAIDFHQNEEPTYADFAYLAFTIGMTYQVSDTDLRDRRVRSTALTQAMLSFLLGAIILAITINLVAGLANFAK